MLEKFANVDAHVMFSKEASIFRKFAGPPAHGVSECGQQFPVPGHCSLRVLDSSSGVQRDTIYGIPGDGSGGRGGG